MDSLDMCLEVRRFGKRLATIGADNNVSLMDPLVCLQVIITRKNLVTVGAAKRLVTYVESMVCLQVI